MDEIKTDIAKPEPNTAEMVKKIYEKEVASEEKKPKKFKLPFSARISNARASKGYTTVQVIRNNGDMQITRMPIEDGTIIVDGIPRISTVDYKLNYKGKPWVIIPEWSLKPFSAAENYEQSVKDRMNVAGRKVILSKLEKEIIKPKKGLGGFGGWILLIVVVAVGGYLLFKGGLF